MLIMLTTGYCNFFWGCFCHVGYQQALQCQGLQSVYNWFTLAQGSNEVYFFTNDPIFLPKILIPNPKTNDNFDP